MKTVIKYVSVIAMLAASSCKQNLPAGQYVKYVVSKDNGMRKEVDLDGWNYVIQYRPYDYIVLVENSASKGHIDIAKRKDELRGTAWFNISFRRTDGSVSPLRYNISSIEEYNTRLNYFLNEAKENISLTYGKIVLKPISYLFENNYNLTPQETIVVGFALPKGEAQPSKEMQLAYTDAVFKNGIIKAKYSPEQLNNIPNLTY